MHHQLESNKEIYKAPGSGRVDQGVTVCMFLGLDHVDCVHSSEQA